MSARCESLSLLFPLFKNMVIDLLLDHNHRATKENQLYTFESYRSVGTQNFYYNKGRTTTEAKITNARGYESMHQYGLAVDLVFGGPRKWHWNGDYSLLEKLISETKGLKWGGDWGDEPHVQLDVIKPVQETMIAMSLEGKTTLDCWNYLLCLSD